MSITLQNTILLLTIAALAAVQGQLDLNATCAGAQQYHCVISNLRDADVEQLANVKVESLQSLIIRNSSIRMLPAELFILAPQLAKLTVHNSRLHHLSYSEFAESHHLTQLNLQFNMLPHIPANTISHAYMLQQLLLGYNNIMSIDDNAFEQMTLLKYLELQGNELEHLPTNLFTDLLNLEYLDLSRNKLQRIDAQTFAMNMRLRTLLLNHNEFSVFASNALEHLPKLHLLDLSNCRLNELYLNSVVTLLVSYSGLKRLVLADAAQQVLANHNELRTVEMRDPSACIELNLRSNNVSSLADIALMSNLQHLDLMRNQLQTLSVINASAELPLPSLNYLNLAGNQLQHLSSENFLVMKKLSHLDLSQNALTQLDVRIFDGLVNLEKLYIEHNALQTLAYEQLHRRHKTLTVLAPFGNRWDWAYLHKMLLYLKDHGVEVIKHAKFNDLQQDINVTDFARSMHDQHDVLVSALKEHANLTVKSAQSDWTKRDVFLAIGFAASLLAVIVLVLRMRLTQPLFSNFTLGAKFTQPSKRTENSHQRLTEEDSEV